MKILTSLEVAELLKLTGNGEEDADAVRAVHRLVREHGLRPINGFKSYRFAEAEIERWILASTEQFENGGTKSP